MELRRAEFRNLFDAERDSLYRYLYRLTGSREDAEDLLQDAFVAVWRKRGQFEGRGSLAGYLRTTAFRLFLNQWKRGKRRTELAPPPGPPRTTPPADGEVITRDLHAFLLSQVRDALGGLPEDSRHAFELFRFHGLTAREIAEATGTPVKTVETRVRRATRFLAERLEQHRHQLRAG